MKIDVPPYGALPPHAIPSTELRNLFQIIQYTLTPQNLPALQNSNELTGLLLAIKQHCENYIRELLPYTCFGVDTAAQPGLQNNWCALNALLDITYGYTKTHPTYSATWQAALEPLVTVYDFLNTHFKDSYPANSKMPDIMAEKYIGTLQAGYQQVLGQHKDNGLLKALLHPLWEVIKRSGQGNNTFHRITYAFKLLGRVKLWHQHKGSYNQLYDIALSMNINSPAFLKYLNKMGKDALATYADLRGRQQQIRVWEQQHREAIWINTRTAASTAYNAKERHVATFFTDWLKEQKECLERAVEGMDEKMRLELAHDLEFFCWDTRIKTEVGYYKTNVLKPIALALADIISTKNAPVPSVNTIEKLIYSTEIPYKTREELDKHLTRCLKLLFKYPVKGAPPAKRKPKDAGPDAAKDKTKPRSR